MCATFHAYPSMREHCDSRTLTFTAQHGHGHQPNSVAQNEVWEKQQPIFIVTRGIKSEPIFIVIRSIKSIKSEPIFIVSRGIKSEPYYTIQYTLLLRTRTRVRKARPGMWCLCSAPVHLCCLTRTDQRVPHTTKKQLGGV